MEIDKDCESSVCKKKLQGWNKEFNVNSVKNDKNVGGKANIVVCPPDIDELGRSTWTLLHALAANYPEKEEDAEKRREMGQFVKGFGQFYPCHKCQPDMEKYLKEDPPDSHLGGRKEFSLWMCQLHNKVNKSVGKPQFDCNLVFERWRESSNPKCQ